MTAEPLFQIASYVPGRARVRFARRVYSGRLLERIANHVRYDAATVHVRAAADARSLEIHCHKGISREEIEGLVHHAFLAAVGRTNRDMAGTALTPAATDAALDPSVELRGGTVMRHAVDVAPRNAARLVLASAVAAAAAMEVVPAALVWSGLAVAAAPVARRSLAGLRHGRLSTDQLDLANLSVLLWIGDLTGAGQITWVICLSDVLRSARVNRVRRHLTDRLLESVLGTDARARQIEDMVEHASVTNARLEHKIMRAGDRLTGPVLGAGGLVLAATGDPLRCISVLKFADLTSDARIAAPTTILSAITAGLRCGYVLGGARCIERLARVDALALDNEDLLGPADERADTLDRLAACGVRVVVTPAGGASENGDKSGDRPLRVRVRDLQSATDQLRSQGYKIAIASDRPVCGIRNQHEDVRILVVRDEFTPHTDLALLAGDVRDLHFALSGAKDAMRRLEQNLRLVAAPTSIGLVASVLGLASPLFTTLIHHGTTAVAGLNALSPLLRHRTSRTTLACKTPGGSRRSAARR